jgi:D-alanine-D-alanine ligase
MQAKPLNVVVMLGGPSAEREVSLRSGAAVAGALRSLGHQVSEVDPRPGAVRLPAATDVVFLALHGTYGEDGTVQAELERLGVPYTGCGVAASRAAFDKVQTKERCRAAGVPTADYFVVTDARAPWPDGWEPPVVVKPVCQGSSVGLAFVARRADWAAALGTALKHDARALVERQIAGRETTVGILGGAALPVVEVRPKAGAYDYQNKYTPGATEYLCPAPLDPAVTRRIQQAGLGAFAAVGGRDYARVDVMVTAGGDPVVLEVNTLPGMTETSLLPKAAKAAGIGYAELCQEMVELALARVGRPVETTRSRNFN